MAEGLFAFAARRAGVNVLLLMLVSLTGFMLLHATPGGPLAQFSLSPGMTTERLNQIAHSMGLDQPLWLQYVKWLGGLLKGDWGHSYRDHAPVLSIIVAHLGATVELGLASLVISFLGGLAMGLIGALRAGEAIDALCSLVGVILLSLPTFWLGLVFIYFLSVRTGWFPAGGLMAPGDASASDRLRHLALPAMTLGLVSIPVWGAYVRAFAGDTLNQDHIRTARALGVPGWRIVLRRVLPAALLPLIPIAGVYLPTLLSGALVTETVFTWPGVGRLFLDSLQYRDYPVALGVLMFSAVLVLICSLAAELLHHAADPRLRA
ncbi:dipeptide/oligopeptide/nickel ABC transporter permease [Acetobacter nitrogenifigens DSM 23921 = NBRC 105050]|uniref:ABC transporter permease n=1 Tax=Acetobacter nitrogenifigens DSM 23921 = NBRC 105050 TaxID=1120919 RepID=A0A511XBQ8_9PROT|nr:ABC transporter permease [Acetobacter nitrogenifigens]GBQ90421.1 dipeptide/oligopeptide/nickel ABC transporter permease [Acetobacter nitrogenifigens DSM 23921 = NBRC 105050]GEN60352.1 ABC transporter permease [Acetobacter nitrogenifigens DSM 23921 = NBRC 105050]